MKKLAYVLALCSAVSVPAFAGSCVALDYQEMKDMSVNDLVIAACKIRAANDENFKDMMENLDVRRGPKPHPNADTNLEQCTGQRDRLLRVLKTKGVTEKLPALCEQQAQGVVITAAEAK